MPTATMELPGLQTKTTVYQMTPTQLAAVQRMKRQGFTHAKIELEAQLNRSYSDNYVDCETCDSGYVDCYDCDGTGVRETETSSNNGRILQVTEVCGDCDGDGQTTCGECDGDGRQQADTDWESESDCEAFILRNVTPEARNALVYQQFYNDGSVDSEFTFTVRMEDIHLAVEFLDAFRLLSDEIGGGMDTYGSGMHLSVLTEGEYPCSTNLDRNKISNFKREVTKILPALYFVASPDHASRPLDFRHPLISDDKSGDYPAICTHDDTILEYRIFETCYQQPEMLLENFEVIANTLKYYSNRPLNYQGPSADLGNRYEHSGGVARFYDTTDRLEALNRALPFIKPKDKTIRQMKAQRNFKLTQAQLGKREKIKKRRAEADYQRYVEDTEKANETALTRMREVWGRLQHYDPNSWRGSDEMMLETLTVDVDTGNFADKVAALDVARTLGYYQTPQGFDEWYRRNHTNY